MSVKLRQVREREGLSRAELGRISGVSERTIQRAEAGSLTMPTIRYKLLNALKRRSERLQTYALDDLFDLAPDSGASNA